MFSQAVSDVCDGRSCIPNFSVSALSDTASRWLQATFGTSRTTAAIAAACAGVAVAQSSLITLSDIITGTNDFFSVLCAREPHILLDLRTLMTNPQLVERLLAACVDAGLESVMYEVFLRHARAHPSFGAVSFAVECVEELNWTATTSLEHRMASTYAALRDAAMLAPATLHTIHRQAPGTVKAEPALGRNALFMSSIAGILLRFEKSDGEPVRCWRCLHLHFTSGCTLQNELVVFIYIAIVQEEQLFCKHENYRWSSHSDSSFAIEVVTGDACHPSKTFVMIPMRGDPLRALVSVRNH
jgi:hypothetical protein